MAKKYAQLVKTEKIDVRRKEDENVWYKSWTSKDGKYSIRCPNCGNIFVENEKNRKKYKDDAKEYFDYVYEKCPACGAERNEDEGYRQTGGDMLIIKSAMHFHNADGSHSVSIMSVKPDMFRMKNGEFGSRVTYVRERIIFSSNGHTYLKAPINIKTGRRVLRGKYPAGSIRDITYSFQEYSFKRMMPQVFTELDALKNRFRGLSEKFLKDIEANTGYYGEGRTNPIFRCIGMNDDDATALAHLTEKYHLPKGKKFRKMMVEHPIGVAKAWSNYRKLGLDDVNVFYAVYVSVCEQQLEDKKRDPWFILPDQKQDPSAGKDPEMLELGENDMRKVFEHVNDRFKARKESLKLAKRFTKKALKELLVQHGVMLIQDILSMTRNIMDAGVSEDVVERRCFKKNSVYKTHENVRRMYQMLQKQNRMKSAMETIFNAYNSRNEGNMVSAYCSLVQNADMEIEYDKKTAEFETEVGGIQFVLPKRTMELEEAGYALHNCVGTYKINAATHQDTIVFMKKGDDFVGCIEVNPNGTIRQAFAPCNESLEGKERAAFDKWCKKLHLGEKGYYSAVAHQGIKYTKKMEEALESFIKSHQKEYEAWVEELQKLNEQLAYAA